MFESRFFAIGTGVLYFPGKTSSIVQKASGNAQHHDDCTEATDFASVYIRNQNRRNHPQSESVRAGTGNANRRRLSELVLSSCASREPCRVRRSCRHFRDCTGVQGSCLGIPVRFRKAAMCYCTHGDPQCNSSLRLSQRLQADLRHSNVECCGQCTPVATMQDTTNAIRCWVLMPSF